MVVGRLAPSPTGAQHVGNARTYLLAWLSARQQSGRVVLRMEDIDSPRIKGGADQQALDDLRWLGLDWDEGPDIGGPEAPYQQTQRIAHYAEALQKLRAADKVYPCTCSRSDVAAAASAPHIGQEGPRYPGTCSRRAAADAADLDRAGQSYCWRWRSSDRQRSIDDLVCGPQQCRVQSELGDFVIAKADGNPSYQLAVVLDDHAMGVTEVVRGDDLLPSAFRQLEIYEHFGFTAPRYAHVPLVVGSDGRRLAKRHGDTRLSQLREAGVPAERLVGYLAWSCGWLERPQPIAARALLSSFDWARLPRQPWVLTSEQWQALLQSTP